MIGAEAIVKCLEAEGVQYVFGYPGVAICPFYNSILDSDIRTILVRTEQNAAHSASGVARLTDKPGVCAVTSGPGATNLVTGIATAFMDSPVFLKFKCKCGLIVPVSLATFCTRKVNDDMKFKI